MPEPTSDKGVFVGSGGFLVDRARALEKLRAFQLADAGDFSLPWIRCAVLSIASRIRLRTVRHGLELRFDGKPLDPRLFEDPYFALLDDTGEDAGRHRQLALGLLAALQLKQKGVHIETGKGEQRRSLEVASEREESESSPAEPRSADTILTVRFDAWRDFSRWDFIERPRLRCRMLPIPLFLGSEESPISVPPSGLPELTADDGVEIHGHIPHCSAAVCDKTECLGGGRLIEYGVGQDLGRRG